MPAFFLAVVLNPGTRISSPLWMAMKAVLAFLTALVVLWFIDDHFNRGRYAQGITQMIRSVTGGRL